MQIVSGLFLIRNRHRLQGYMTEHGLEVTHIIVGRQANVESS